MRLGPFFRVIGALLYGFIGWELGIALAGTMELTTQTWQIIVPSTVAGLLFGLIFAPWIITAPAVLWRMKVMTGSSLLHRSAPEPPRSLGKGPAVPHRVRLLP